LARFWPPTDRLQTFALLEKLCQGIAAELRHRVREEPGVQLPSRTLALGGGSCRDLATLFMALARTLGLAARFAGGYLVTPSGDKGSGATHAWAEVYLPGAGWKGLDPTLGRLTGSDHIPVAVARRPEAVLPVAGSFVGPDTACPVLQVQVNVTPL
jgi:transglutaminase-like putative cysteine protease